MASIVNTQGHSPLLEYREDSGRYFIVFPGLDVELSMAPREYGVAYYLAYHSSLGSPFHNHIPCFPRNTPYPRPNIIYPDEVPMAINLVDSSGKALEVAIPQQKEEAVMATTVTVKARAWGALVIVTKKTEGEEGHNVETREHEVPANTTQDFVITEGERIQVEMGAAPPAGGDDPDTGEAEALVEDEDKDDDDDDDRD